MTLDLGDCTFSGAALPAAFLQGGLALTPRADVEAVWDRFRIGLRGGGQQRVHTSVTARLAAVLGYGHPVQQQPVSTREGKEDGGWLLRAGNGSAMRTWTFGEDVDPDLPVESGRGRRETPTRIAQRVMMSAGERIGLIVNGQIIRVLLCDDARTDSHVTVDIAAWPQLPLPPDSFRLLMRLASADGVPDLSGLLEAARLHQAKVTRNLRAQAKEAIVRFINALPSRGPIPAATLWHQALVLVYRLLFVLKLESTAEPGAGFSFATATLWSGTFSPTRALAPLIRWHLDHGHQTGSMLETGLRLLFQVFREGFTCSELRIAPLGGTLFDTAAMAELDRIPWGDRAVAELLDRLIWTTTSAGERARVHYGTLDVEELGAIYESLLEQEPYIAGEPPPFVCSEEVLRTAPADEDARPGQFFLRIGTRRKSSGSYYTPRAFVRFMVREALKGTIASICPHDDPYPARLLRLKIVDPAMGSGHFLVEACRFLADALLAACRTADERGLSERIAELPDPDHSLLAYLPSRGWSEAHARAICRRLVAVHCLYGCDRNPLAVELAKLSLWLESYAEGLPLTFLDHRLVQGDALTGPCFDALKTLPVTGGALDPLLAAGVASRLDDAMTQARWLVDQLDATLGRNVHELERKQGIKQRLDGLLHPLRQLARAWAGAAMLGERDSDDIWLQLAQFVAEAGSWPLALTAGQQAVLEAGAAALPWNLMFPEAENGFDAVLGNPPWDVMLPSSADFLADLDVDGTEVPGRVSGSAGRQALLSRPGIAAAFEQYRAGFDRVKRIVPRLYHHQRVVVGSSSTSGSLDLFRLFAERALQLAATGGTIGLLLPAAFHANEGSTGVRRLYLQHTAITWLLSFENRRRIFDIDSRFKFDIVIAHRPGPTRSFRCAFYLERIEDAEQSLVYDMPFLKASGGPNLTPLELRAAADVDIARRMFAHPVSVGAWCGARGVRFGRDLHMTGDAALFRPAGSASLVLHEGKTFHQYSDRWDTPPRYSIEPERVRRPILQASMHYRLAFRDIARATDERTMIACVMPPSMVFGHTATVEKTPWARDIVDILTLCAVFNAFPFDWLVRQKAATHLSLYLLDALPMPAVSGAVGRRLAAGALTLSGRHAGYRTLRAACSGLPQAHGGADLIRADLDALVAHAYGLCRKGYEQILGSFSHRSWPQAPVLCLKAFDALVHQQKQFLGAVAEPA